MLVVQRRRKGLLVLALTSAFLYWIVLHDSTVRSHAVKHLAPLLPVGLHSKNAQSAEAPLDGATTVDALDKAYPDIDKPDAKDVHERPDVEPSKPLTDEDELKKQQQEERDRHEEAVRSQFEQENEALGRQPGAGAIYGNTVTTLTKKTPLRKLMYENALKPAGKKVGFSDEEPQIYDPYPLYNGKEWKAIGKAEFVPCNGPDDVPVDDIMVFKGVPHDFPEPAFGSYDVLDMDGNLCFERETRLSPYGYSQRGNRAKKPGQWNRVKWDQLQETCVQQNKARFEMKQRPNPFLEGLYITDIDIPFVAPSRHKSSTAKHPKDSDDIDQLKRADNARQSSASGKARRNRRGLFGGTTAEKSNQDPHESRTALLIRTYTGKEYSENDKQIIRSLVTELSLRTGGQYQVFLFVHVKDESIGIWDNEETYEWVLHRSVPPEFVDMTVLWNDEATRSTYPSLTPEQASVHVGQWLSVQKFSQEFSEFDYVWNWELDSRVTGHHFEFLEKISAFAKKQPRRGLWERNDRYYIPSVHGDYDTDFRKEIESRAVNGSVWGPPDLPFIHPVGPRPPVKKREDDNFQWGIGEEADLITLAPIFNPVNTSWVAAADVWGYNDSTHTSQDLPRRTTIITQSRVSRRLLDIMHVENLRGNHVASEMTPQTVALIHGLKAVYAPMPIFFDRAWSGQQLSRWFNGGPNGESGGDGSAMGWGREGRFGGSTWYFRANPPQRLYTNWMGWEDTGIGGPAWEKIHGRPCLPPMILHPIKDVVATGPGHSSESRLPY